MLVVYAPTDGTGELLSTWSLCEGRVCVWCHMDRLSGHKKIIGVLVDLFAAFLQVLTKFTALRRPCCAY